MQKILYILRHAKAETGSAGQDDHARLLSRRGVGDVELVAAHLVKLGIHPDKVLCSTAIRTSETFIKLEEAFRHNLPVEFSEKLYLASGNEILNVIAGVPDEIEKLMVIAHNPGLHQLCLKLVHAGDATLLDALALKLPTCAFAGIDLGPESWKQIRNARGILNSFITPKMLGGGQE